MKNILIPVDGSDYSIKAIRVGREIANAFDSKVTILNVIPIEFNLAAGRANLSYVPTLPDEVPGYAVEILDQAKSFFQGTRNEVETVCKQGNIVDSIVDYAHEHNMDLVIMGSHGLGALKNRLMTGSTTTRVLHHIDVPVLVIK